MQSNYFRKKNLQIVVICYLYTHAHFLISIHIQHSLYSMQKYRLHIVPVVVKMEIIVFL